MNKNKKTEKIHLLNLVNIYSNISLEMIPDHLLNNDFFMMNRILYVDKLTGKSNNVKDFDSKLNKFRKNKKFNVRLLNKSLSSELIYEILPLLEKDEFSYYTTKVSITECLLFYIDDLYTYLKNIYKDCENEERILCLVKKENIIKKKLENFTNKKNLFFNIIKYNKIGIDIDYNLYKDKIFFSNLLKNNYHNVYDHLGSLIDLHYPFRKDFVIKLFEKYSYEYSVEYTIDKKIINFLNKKYGKGESLLKSSINNIEIKYIGEPIYDNILISYNLKKIKNDDVNFYIIKKLSKYNLDKFVIDKRAFFRYSFVRNINFIKKLVKKNFNEKKSIFKIFNYIEPDFSAISINDPIEIIRNIYYDNIGDFFDYSNVCHIKYNKKINYKFIYYRSETRPFIRIEDFKKMKMEFKHIDNMKDYYKYVSFEERNNFIYIKKLLEENINKFSIFYSSSFMNKDMILKLIKSGINLLHKIPYYNDDDEIVFFSIKNDASMIRFASFRLIKKYIECDFDIEKTFSNSKF